MKSEQIKAIGNFLMYYKSDLDYIKSFQDFKNNKIKTSEYIEKKYSTFYTFLIEFKVMRNCSKGMVDKLLEETLLFINSKNSNDVDLFAENLARTNITHGKVMTSMASKILFLNNPWEIFPLDNLAKKTLKQKENKYHIYKLNLKTFFQKNSDLIIDCVNFVKPIAEIINKDFDGEIKNSEIILKNRMFDKLLWTMGK